jgi:hypothetical protein
MTKAALAIENLSGGAVKGEAVIKALSRGMQDPEGAAAIEALSKKFPQLTEQLKGSGDAASKLAAINAELAPTFATMAEQSNDAGGTIQKLQNTLARGFEEAGAQILDSIAPAITAISDQLSPLILQLGPVIKSLIGAIGPVVETLGKTIGNLLTTLAPVVTKLLGTLGPVLAQLVGIVGGLIDKLLKGLGPVLGIIADLIGTLVKAIAPIIVALGDALGPVIDTLTGSLGELVGSLAPLITMLVQALSPILVIVARIIGVQLNVVMKILGGVISLVAGAINGLVGFIKFLADGFMNIVKNSEFLTKAFDAIKEAVMNLIGYLPDFIKEALGLKESAANVAAVGDAAEDAAGSVNALGNESDTTKEKVKKTGKEGASAFELMKKQVDELRKSQQDSLKLEAERVARLVQAGNLTKEEGELRLKAISATQANILAKKTKELFQAALDKDGFAISTKIKGPDEANANAFVNDVLIAAGVAQRALDAKPLKVKIVPDTVEADVLADALKQAEASPVNNFEAPITFAFTDLTDAFDTIDKLFGDIDYSEILKPLDTAFLDSLEGQEDALTASLKNREKSWSEYSQSVGEIDAKRTKAQKKQYDLLDVVSQVFNKAAGKAFGEQAAESRKAFDASAKAGEASYKQLALYAAQSAAAQIVSGESAGKAAVMSALSALEAMVPILMVKIFGEYASLGPLGLLGFAAASATLLGLLAVARNAASGFKDGGYTGNGANTDVAGVVHKKEFVSKESVTNRYRGILEFMHSGGDPALYYPRTVVPAPTGDNVEVVKEMRGLRKDLSKQRRPSNHNTKIDVRFDKKAVERGLLQAQYAYAQKW